MPGTLQVTHSAIGAEVRRNDYDVVVDGTQVGSVAMNDTFELPVAAGSHALQVGSGRQSSRTTSFEIGDGEVVAYRCTGKRFLPIFLVSFLVPRLALTLVRQ